MLVRCFPNAQAAYFTYIYADRFHKYGTGPKTLVRKEQQNKTSDVVTTYITSHIIRHTTQAHETLDLQA